MCGKYSHTPPINIGQDIMNHKIEINIADEDIRVIQSILHAYHTNSNDDTLVSSLTLEDAVVLGILKQTLYKLQEIKG